MVGLDASQEAGMLVDRGLTHLLTAPYTQSSVLRPTRALTRPNTPVST